MGQKIRCHNCSIKLWGNNWQFTLKATPFMLNKWPCKLKFDEKQSKHANLVQENGFPNLKWLPCFDGKCLQWGPTLHKFPIKGWEMVNMFSTLKVHKVILSHWGLYELHWYIVASHLHYVMQHDIDAWHGIRWGC